MRTDISRSVVFLIVGGPLHSPDRRSLRPVIDRLREVRRRHLREIGLQPSHCEASPIAPVPAPPRCMSRSAMIWTAIGRDRVRTYSAMTPAPVMRDLTNTRVREVYRTRTSRVQDGLQPLRANKKRVAV
jgi:hypothetical protein